MATLSRQSFTAEPDCMGIGEPPCGELVETEFAYLVEAPLSGARKGDLSVRLDGQDLVISAVIRRRCRTGLLRWRTDCDGRLAYRLTLPGSGEHQGLQVFACAGRLSVRIPKTDRSVAVPPVGVEAPSPVVPPAPEPVPARRPLPPPLPSPLPSPLPGSLPGPLPAPVAAA